LYQKYPGHNHTLKYAVNCLWPGTVLSFHSSCQFKYYNYFMKCSFTLGLFNVYSLLYWNYLFSSWIMRDFLIFFFFYTNLGYSLIIFLPCSTTKCSRANLDFASLGLANFCVHSCVSHMKICTQIFVSMSTYEKP
jgi:hypothetical protein